MRNKVPKSFVGAPRSLTTTSSRAKCKQILRKVETYGKNIEN